MTNTTQNNAAIQETYNNYAATTQKSTKKSNYGKTIGDVELSEEAGKYYESLKKKFSNMDFVLVSEDQKANAQANAAKYANPAKTVVLIDVDKIEKMATDKNFREKYESIIANSASGLSQMKEQMEKSGANVQGYGMQVNDGGMTSFFAVLKKSSSDQKARIEKHQAEVKAEKKAEAKKAAKKEAEERLHNKIGKKDNDYDKELDEDTVTITASSLEELMQKISDYNMAQLSDQVFTEEEMKVGQTIDFKG